MTRRLTMLLVGAAMAALMLAMAGVALAADPNPLGCDNPGNSQPPGGGAPFVRSTNPLSDAGGVGLDVNIKAKFSETMLKGTINGLTVRLYEGNLTSAELCSTTDSPIEAAVSYNKKKKLAILNPASSLKGNTQYTALVEGASDTDAFAVQDRSGTTMATDLIWHFTTAGTNPPPETTIDSGPPSLVNLGSAEFRFSSSEANSSFECSLNGAAFTSCTSPKTVPEVGPLGDGLHIFEVRAIDTTGSPDLTPASHTWTVDTTGPDASITGGPSNLVNSRSASYTFSGAEPGGSYECKIDGVGSTGTFSACSSGDSFTVGADGTYTLSVRASDVLGNFGTPATRTWKVDTAVPTVNNVSPTAAATGVALNTNVTATFSEAMNASSISAQTFTLTEQGTSSPVAATLSYNSTTRVATLNPSSDLATTKTYTATITTGVKDLAGNALEQSYSWTFTTGTASPTVVSYAPLPTGSPPGPSTNVTATFSVDMDPSSITNQTFTLTRQGSSSSVAAQVTYNSATKTATLNPDSNLATSTFYTALIKSGSKGVKDLAGNTLGQDHSWSFMPCDGGVILSARAAVTPQLVICG